MKKISLLLASLTCCCFSTAPAHADEILLGTPHDRAYSTAGIHPFSAQAEGFYLTQAVTLTGINIGIFSDSGNSIVFQLTDRIGLGTTPSNVLASFPIAQNEIPADPIDYCGANPSVPGCASPYPGIQNYLSISLAPLVLQPGEYFLDGGCTTNIATSGCLGAAWETESSVLPSSVGGIGPRFSTSDPNVSNLANSVWQPFTADNSILDFQLLGTVNAVPEPSGLLLLGTGLLSLWGMQLRRRTRRSHRGNRVLGASPGTARGDRQ